MSKGFSAIRASVTAGLVAFTLLGLAIPAQAAPQTNSYDLLTDFSLRIDGAVGALGYSGGDHIASSISHAGDVNGDGVDDVIISAYHSDNSGGQESGSAYVVFGEENIPFPSTIDLASLDATRGFRIDGANTWDWAGISVDGVGDINEDDYDDVIIGASKADNNGRVASGSAYVVFGNGNDTSTVNVGALGSRGFRIDGAASHDNAGTRVAGVGDVSNDGIPDVIVGAPEADNNGYNSGSAYVVFGNGNDTSTVDVGALGSRGFRIDGATGSWPHGDDLGREVSRAGDVNDDGTPDVIVGAATADNNGEDSGSAYVVFGNGNDTSTVDVGALGSRGFRIDGAQDVSQDNGAMLPGAGHAVSEAGDVNDDGIDDVMVGAPNADNNGRINSGSAYVVFGKRNDTGTVSLAALGSRGFRIDGAAGYVGNCNFFFCFGDQTGWSGSISSVGDVSGDGVADIIVGSHFADNNGRGNSGAAYILYGKSDTSTVDLANIGIPGNSEGILLDGAAARDRAGAAVSGAGDFNGDGQLDVIIGAPSASNNLREGSGSAYLIFNNWNTTTVSGKKFDDLNGDGDDENGTDPGLGGWRIYVDYDGNGQLDGSEPWADTNADGNYTIRDVRPGRYAVREVGQNNWTCSYPDPCSYTVTFTSGDTETGKNFGNWKDSTVSGKKFDDLDGDGRPQERGEPELPGWKIYVDYDGNGQLDAGEPSDVTNDRGNYTVRGVKPGRYAVREVGQNNWTCSYPDPCSYTVTFTSGVNKIGKNFGNWKDSTVSGKKFDDLDGDGQAQEAGEQELENWRIYVDYDGNGQRDGGEPSDLTNPNGKYTIEGVKPGSYAVREVGQSGWTCSYPDPCSYSVTFTSGDTEMGKDFGNWEASTVEGTKFEDLDADGQPQESGEQGLPDWEIYVDYDNNGQLDAGEPSNVTESSGKYTIEGVKPGTYKIREVGKPGWTCSYPATCSYAVTFSSGDTETGKDFGNWATGSVSGTKFEDLDADGQPQEPGERVLPNWTIYVDYDGNGQLDAGEPSDLTDVNGDYTISGVRLGTYKIREVNQTDWTCSFPSPCYYEETFRSNQHLINKDLGSWLPATIEGTKFEDLDRDGQPKEPGEPGLEGWKIYIDLNDDGQLNGNEPSADTDSTGKYTIAGIKPGTYKIREVGKAGWTCSYPSTCLYEVTLISNGHMSNRDFGSWRESPPPPPPPPGIQTPLGQPSSCGKVLYENKLRVSREIRLSDLIKRKGVKVYASASEASTGSIKIEINGRQARQFKIYRKNSKIKSKLFARTKIKISTKEKGIYLKAKGKQARLIRKALRLKRAPKRTKLKVSLVSQSTANNRLKRLNTQTIRALRKGKVKRTDRYKKIRQVIDKTGCGKPLKASIKGPRQTKLTVLTSKRANRGRGTKVTVECSEDCTAKIGYRLWGRYEIGLKFRKKGQKMNRLLFQRNVKLRAGKPRTFKLGGVVSKKLRKLLVRGAKKKRYDRIKMKYVIEGRRTYDNGSGAGSGTSRVMLRFK